MLANIFVKFIKIQFLAKSKEKQKLVKKCYMVRAMGMLLPK